MNDNLTSILLALLGLCSTIITAVVVPYMKTKLGSQKSSDLAKLVQIGVSAAEQIFTETKAGQKKKEWVLNWLKSQNIDVDNPLLKEQIEALIESFCYGLNSKSNVLNC